MPGTRATEPSKITTLFDRDPLPDQRRISKPVSAGITMPPQAPAEYPVVPASTDSQDQSIDSVDGHDSQVVADSQGTSAQIPGGGRGHNFGPARPSPVTYEVPVRDASGKITRKSTPFPPCRVSLPRIQGELGKTPETSETSGPRPRPHGQTMCTSSDEELEEIERDARLQRSPGYRYLRNQKGNTRRRAQQLREKTGDESYEAPARSLTPIGDSSQDEDDEDDAMATPPESPMPLLADDSDSDEEAATSTPKEQQTPPANTQLSTPQSTQLTYQQMLDLINSEKAKAEAAKSQEPTDSGSSSNATPGNTAGSEQGASQARAPQGGQQSSGPSQNPGESEDNPVRSHIDPS